MNHQSRLVLVLLSVVLSTASCEAQRDSPASLSELRAQGFQVTTLDGRVVPLNHLLPADAPVVIEFWASWCGPCHKTLPNLARLHSEFGQRGLVVIGLTVEDPVTDTEKVKTFVEKAGVPFTIAFAPDEVFRYATRSRQIRIPKIIVYDANGTVHGYETGYSPFTNRRVATAVRAAMLHVAGRHGGIE
jgi:thiol-disulfide isomerase/thioredoxin